MLQITLYLVIVLCDTKTFTFVKEVYSQATFPFTLENAEKFSKSEELVTDRMIYERLAAYFEKLEVLPQLKDLLLPYLAGLLYYKWEDGEPRDLYCSEH